jgi:hypothetical protein
MAKVKHVWKEKVVDGKRLMICQNSKPEYSKHPDWAPEDGPCDQWSEVGTDTTAVTCYKCTMRSQYI